MLWKIIFSSDFPINYFNKEKFIFLKFDKFKDYDFKKFFEKIDNVHGVELTLYSDHYELAGRTDLVAEFDGVLSIIDYKTSNKIKKKEWCESYFAQCSFYANAYRERTGIKVPQVVIIIAVENEQPQLFVEKVEDWEHIIWKAKELYELNINDTVDMYG